MCALLIRAWHAEVAAKEGSQETAVTLLGLVLGMLFAHSVNQYPLAIWVAFVLLTGLHVVANHAAVTCLQLRHLNLPRAEVAFRRFTKRETLTVAHINRLEPVLPSFSSSWFSVRPVCSTRFGRA